MNKLNREQILSETKDLIHQLFPTLKLKNASLEDKRSYFLLFYYLDSSVAIEISVDIMDQILSFRMIKLNEEGNRFDGFDYTFPGKEGPIRLSFASILMYLNMPADKKKVAQIASLPPDFQLQDNCNEMLMQRIKDGLLLYAPILKDEQSILAQLHNKELWAKIGE